MIAVQQTARNGKVVAAALVHPDDESCSSRRAAC
jgi:hypothetical protein